MVYQNLPFAQSADLGCQGKILFPQGQYLGTDHSGRGNPVSEAHGNQDTLYGVSQKHHNQNHINQAGNTGQDIHHTHHDNIRGSSHIA